MNQFHETTERTYTDAGSIADIMGLPDAFSAKTIMIYDKLINMEASICVSAKFMQELMGDNKEMFIKQLDELADRSFETRLQKKELT